MNGARPRLSFVLPFYDNVGMLRDVQYPTWASYPDELKAQIEIVVVDDGSPSPALDVPRPVGLPSLRIYRVLVDIPWHQHGARNLGAREAAGAWLLLTDMDHVLRAADLAALLARLDGDEVFTFHRLDAPALTPKLTLAGAPHPHPNTFALRRERYWSVGGYDEDCRGYGTDGFFRQRLFAACPHTPLLDVAIVRYSRDVVPDASTRTLARKEGRTDDRRRNRERVEAKRAAGLPPTVLAFPWERVL